MVTEDEICRAVRRSDAAKVAVKIAFGLAMGFSLSLIGTPATAIEPSWPAGTYKYITVDQAVDDALIEFGKNTGVPVRVSKQVKGRLSAGMPVGTAREFLEWVCNRYGLVWHFDGSVLNVATEAEVRTEIFKLDANAASGAAERLATLGVSDSRYPIKVSEKDDVVSVSGPPSYVALVKKTLGVPSAARVAQDKTSVVPVRIFRGRSAVAQNFPAGNPQ
jgi:type II secretory pathway component GspD/PulD (secretin)